MAEDFQTGGTCSGSWWSAAATLSCSTAITDIGYGDAGRGGGFSWATAVAAELPESKALSGEDSAGSCSGSSITQASDIPPSASAFARGQFIDISGFGLSSPGAVDWNQAFFRNSGSMIQESNQEHHPGGASSGSGGDYVNHNLLLDQKHLSSGEPDGFPITPSPSYNGLTSNLFQSLFESDNTPVNHQSSPPAWLKFSHLIKNSSSPPNQPPPPPAAANNLHFSNNTPFWNATSAGAATDLQSGFYPPAGLQFVSQPPFDHRPPFFSAVTSKANTDQVGREKKGPSETSLKKPRIVAPSPLPTFKVRKEKLGDRITALQQLVSPFGKTDTASVLHEAIEYIKFLQEQVGALSTPYLQNGHPMQNQQGTDKSKDEGTKQDLRSRGLCLVPISSTFPVASETPADFWTPSFGGSYR